MDKVKMTTPDGVTENIEKLAALFPAAVTEMRGEDGTLRKGIDFEKLKQLLSHDIVEGGERYEFSWVGKKAAMAEAARPTTETLRPVKADSRDWDTTENLYIEGDNLAALKILQESYLGKVKMIYIDPPYNTGNDFIYKDNTTHTQYEEDSQMGMFDNDDNHLFKNTDSNGRFHSDWCSMIYSRLLLARNLLSQDGAIFISIDDNEVANITKIMDEIFGTDNRIALICHKSRASVSNDKIISPNHNIILFYAKSISVLESNRKYIGLDPTLDGFDLDDRDGRGSYRLVPVDGPGGAKKGNPFFEFLGVSGYWRFSLSTMQEKYNQGFIVKRGNSLYQKYYKTVAAQTRRTATTWWDDGGLISTATSKLKNLMGSATFDTPKPLELVTRMLKMITHEDKSSIILDFFSGSATTAHAVIQLNAEDGGHRKFIMVQLPEPCDEKSEAYKAGYKNICEIGKERIRRAGDAILKENGCWKSVPLNRNDGSKVGDYTPAKIVNTVNTNKGPVEMVDISKDLSKLDIGFRVFRVDSSNMQDVYYKPEEFTQTMLGEAVSNIKPDRTDLDLLYACLLDCGVPIHLPHTTTTVDGCTIHNVDNGALMACFDEHIPHSVIRTMAAEAPLQVIFRDSAFAADADKINVTEIFKNLSPDTKVRVI
ncbi:site-specific DNA-methyltransferase [Gemmiger formicilis]|uniref:site-specific DNA-methyltransferase n=1 Tax=Gemmiger formicilis TaxID=745368 RepID=UPI00210BAFC3|nr:site-specific DNA-methyltransferase [Gemmiger formicilis]MCQ5080775.1 site-specific DNA-methyltransferase [Gemmiger formicilis]MCQ5117358.1 site-specific DNA-methyltransferase [Gemmiger formicilis]